jgi:hypothetical protein
MRTAALSHLLFTHTHTHTHTHTREIDSQIIWELKKHGANMSAVDTFNASPLHYAASRGNAGAIRALSEAGFFSYKHLSIAHVPRPLWQGTVGPVRLPSPPYPKVQTLKPEPRARLTVSFGVEVCSSTVALS